MKPKFAKGTGIRRRRGEQGQTILLVAVSMVALLSMAALAIDVVSLYVAKSEIQLAADAAALAGAKAIVDSGVTTVLSTDPGYTDAKANALSMANAAVGAIALQANPVAGAEPNPPTVTIVFQDPTGNNLPNDALVTVTLQRPNLPAFFSRLFGSQALSTTATATAEAYNPANISPATPIADQCVKPWLMPNCDPNNITAACQPLIDSSTGQVQDRIGLPFYLSADCSGGQAACLLKDSTPTYLGNQTMEYVPAQIGTTTIVSACASDQYQDSIAGCDPTPYTCGGAATVNWSPIDNPEFNGMSGDTGQGTSCLISAGDQISYAGPNWYDAPPQVRAGSGPLAGQLVTTSNSIVTIPIFAPFALPQSPAPVTIVGFLQAFVQSVGQNPHYSPTDTEHQADVNAVVMNIVGCSETSNGSPPITGGNGSAFNNVVSAGGNSTIPVRLITPP
jgi:Flp pilus assembly protein TadG